MNRGDSDHLILTAIALSVVGALGAALFWQDPIAAAVLAVLAGLSWGLRRLAAAGRQRDEAFEEWRTSPETLAQFLRDMGYRDGDPWEGVASSGPEVPEAVAQITLLSLVDRYGWPGGYHRWSGQENAYDRYLASSAQLRRVLDEAREAEPDDAR